MRKGKRGNQTTLSGARAGSRHLWGEGWIIGRNESDMRKAGLAEVVRRCLKQLLVGGRLPVVVRGNNPVKDSLLCQNVQLGRTRFGGE